MISSQFYSFKSIFTRINYEKEQDKHKKTCKEVLHNVFSFMRRITNFQVKNFK